MNSYEEKQQRRREHLEARAQKTAAAGKQKTRRGMDALDAIPFGQPIHGVRDRNYREKAVKSLQAGFAMHKEAEKIAARAAAVGNGGISADDPDAIQKLREKLVSLEAKQEQMKAENAEWRRAGHRAGRQDDGSWRDAPHPDFALTNSSARIRQVKARIEQLEQNAGRETVTAERAGGIRIVENAEMNRLQIFFPAKPGEETRMRLKRWGFRWAPSVGAWQRQLTNAARWAAAQVVEEVK